MRSPRLITFIPTRRVANERAVGENVVYGDHKLDRPARSEGFGLVIRKQEPLVRTWMSAGLREGIVALLQDLMES